MVDHSLGENCDNPDCILCQADDGDAAFWDEFYFACEESEEIETRNQDFYITAYSEETGESFELDGLEMDNWVPVIID